MMRQLCSRKEGTVKFAVRRLKLHYVVVFIDVFELVEPYFLGEDEPILASIFFELGGKPPAMRS